EKRGPRSFNNNSNNNNNVPRLFINLVPPMDVSLLSSKSSCQCLKKGGEERAKIAQAVKNYKVTVRDGTPPKKTGSSHLNSCPKQMENPYLFTKTNSNTVMSKLISDDDQDSTSDDFPPAAAVALAVCLTAVVVIVVVFVWRTRKSRRRPEARKLLYAPGPHKPRI
ncbi:unnamed protein product, partial [Porites evermanni]